MWSELDMVFQWRGQKFRNRVDLYSVLLFNYIIIIIIYNYISVGFWMNNINEGDNIKLKDNLEYSLIYIPVIQSKTDHGPTESGLFRMKLEWKTKEMFRKNWITEMNQTFQMYERRKTEYIWLASAEYETELQLLTTRSAVK